LQSASITGLRRSGIVASAAAVIGVAIAVPVSVPDEDVYAEGLLLGIGEDLLPALSIADAEAKSLACTGSGINSKSIVAHPDAERISLNQRSDTLGDVNIIIAGTIFRTEEFPTVGLRGRRESREEKNDDCRDDALHKRLLVAPG
jgi:hypothetical protein